jgi:hypothetical protein
MAGSAYTAEEVIEVTHENLKAGDDCPTACGGRVYPLGVRAGGIIRVQGRSCAHVVSYEFKRLRCALCGETFSPPAPAGFKDEKYDAHFKAILAVNKYFAGVPLYRNARYSAMLGVPLSDATQWDCIEYVSKCAKPVLVVLEQMAANGENINHDDTRVKILTIMKENKANPDKKRRGMQTTCVMARVGEQKICLYYSGAKHGGENIGSILEKRDEGLPPIKQMCDALNANMSHGFKTILSNCLAHGRRKFVELEPFFTEECKHVVLQFGLVYHYDGQSKTEKMSDEERLLYHQKHSLPVMNALYTWMEEQIAARKVEPNSPLYKAIEYMQKHWEALTRFLWVAGVDLDNNVVEGALKLAIRIRRNALFYKTEHGAAVGSLILSLIATSELSKKNPIHYLKALQENKEAVAKAPHLWLPWNYEDNFKFQAIEARLEEAA